MYNNFDEINQIMLNISKNKYSVGFCYNAGFQVLHISAPKQSFNLNLRQNVLTKMKDNTISSI